MTGESLWQQFDILNRVIQLLGDVEYERNPAHHFGRPFVTSYQLVIMFEREYPDIVDALGIPVGGRGTGEESLAHY